MEPLRIRVHTVGRPACETDDQVGEVVVGLIRQALARGGAPPAAVVLRADRIDLVPLRPLVEVRQPLEPFLAALTRMGLQDGDPVQAVGLAGVFERRVTRDGPGVPLLMAFLEWPDCRWWQWRALLGEDGVRDDTVTLLRAVDGVGRPPRLGGWWSLGRRTGARLRLRPAEPALVH